MELFAKIIAFKYFRENLDIRCFTGLWIHLRPNSNFDVIIQSFETPKSPFKKLILALLNASVHLFTYVHSEKCNLSRNNMCNQHVQKKEYLIMSEYRLQQVRKLKNRNS